MGNRPVVMGDRPMELRKHRAHASFLLAEDLNPGQSAIKVNLLHNRFSGKVS